MGLSLMPWQQYVADVALEIDPVTGRLAYREVRLTVPRQSGKSTFVVAKAAHRCSATDFFGPRQQLVYTAQTRLKAREKFKEDYEPVLAAATRLRATPGWGPGQEHFRFPNRSRFGIESTTERAGHGSTLDEAFIDEAFAHVDNRVEQSFKAPMITRRNPQMWVISTAGWQDGSPYLWDKVAHGRKLIEAGEPSRVAYFEWSAPQDADPFDRSMWHACMPALGFTIEEDAIEADLESLLDSEDGLNGFRRAYLNQWVPKHAQSSAVPADRWADCATVGSEIVGRPVLAVSMNPQRSLVSVVAAGRRQDGQSHVEVVRHGAAGDWIVTEVAEIARRQGSEVVLHAGHAVGALIPDLLKAKVRLRTITSGEYTQACGAFYDAVMANTLRYPPPQPELDAALRKASRKVSDQAWRWAGEDITALVAATQAVWGASTATQGGKGRVVLLAQ